MIIELTGKTLKGKNRVKENGKLWKVLIENKHDMLVESIKTENWRWVEKHDDPNFHLKINLESK